MTRAGKVDWAALEREYVFDANTPPVSITGIAERHGLARSGVAEQATNHGWYEKRTQFRRSVGEKVVEAFGDEWAQQMIADRELSLAIGRMVLLKFKERLESGEYKPNAKDALAAVAALRALGQDAKAAAVEKESQVIDSDTLQLDPSKLDDIIATAKRLVPGDVSGHAGGASEGGPEGAGED